MILSDFGILVQQPGYLTAFDNMLFNNFFCILRFYLGIKSIVGNDLYNGTLFTETKATGANNLGKITAVPGF